MKEIERRGIEEFIDPAWNLKLNLPKLKLSIWEGVYRPKLDSFLIAKRLSEMALERKKILDVCTGCGIHALIAAEKGATLVIAIDIEEVSVKCTKYNAALNNLEIDVRRGDLFKPIKEGENFDLIEFSK